MWRAGDAKGQSQEIRRVADGTRNTKEGVWGSRESSPRQSSGVSATCWCPDLWLEVAEGAAGAEADWGMRPGHGPGALLNTPAFLGLRTLVPNTQAQPIPGRQWDLSRPRGQHGERPFPLPGSLLLLHGLL